MDSYTLRHCAAVQRNKDLQVIKSTVHACVKKPSIDLQGGPKSEATTFKGPHFLLIHLQKESGADTEGG